MESTNQHKLSLQLTGRGKELEVRAEAAGGQARSETATPPETILTQMAAKRPSTLSQATVDEIGETLYDALLIGEVGQLISHTIEEGRRCNEPVQIELRFDADQITMAKYPWELIRNNLGQYLVRDGVVDMTRCITYPQPMPRLREDLREISLLRLISQPPTLPPITAVELIITNLETIAHATFPKFQKKLLIDRFASWALQFDGHGALILNGPSATG
jgi:hypothetical protein